MGEPSYCRNLNFDTFVDEEITKSHTLYDALLDTVSII